MNEITETMMEKLENEPDAAVLVTIDELDGEESANISLFADHERDDIARRVLACRAAAMLAKHFPNETQHGAAQVAGGRVSYNGPFRDPEADWRALADPESDDPEPLHGADEGDS